MDKRKPLLQTEIEHLAIRFETRYRKVGAAKAFGDEELLALLASITKKQKRLDDTVECDLCCGTASIEHDCVCPLCETIEEPCPRCDDGRINKQV
jgi:hypothetical protein